MKPYYLLTVLLLLIANITYASDDDLSTTAAVLEKHKLFISEAYCNRKDLLFRFYYLGTDSSCISDVSAMVTACFSPDLKNKYGEMISTNEEEKEFGIELASCVYDRQVSQFQKVKCPVLPEPSSGKEIEKVSSKLTEKEKAGIYWTKKLDCRYLNPPKELTIINQGKESCETYTHDLKVIQSGCPYFRSQSTLVDGPIWCLVENTSPTKTGNLPMLVKTFCND